MLGNEQKGPFELEQLPEMGVRPSTYIWCSGMPDWEKAENVADVCRLFRNRLYDIMHPQYKAPDTESYNDEVANAKGETEASLPNPSPTRFDKILNNSSQPPLPTVDEINNRENTSVPPQSMVAYAWLVTFLCFPPTGIAAIVFAYKSQTAWKEGETKIAHDYNRAAKMWTGISLFMGFILYAFLLRFL